MSCVRIAQAGDDDIFPSEDNNWNYTTEIIYISSIFDDKGLARTVLFQKRWTLQNTFTTTSTTLLFLAPCVTLFRYNIGPVDSQHQTVSCHTNSITREQKMSLPVLDERFLEADSRVAEWSMGGAMFGLTAAVVQMLIRSLIVRRDNVGRAGGSSHFIIYIQ